ncbi:MAG: class I SAM-dependent methyltransferase [Acidimicrobiales bacterium]
MEVDGTARPERTACIACDSALIAQRVGVNEMLICQSCGMGHVGGEPQREAYWARGHAAEPLTDGYWESRRKMFRTALDHLEDLARPGPGGQRSSGRLLDLGGGAGHFAEIALDLGWDAYSTDLAPEAADEAARRLGPQRSLRGTTIHDHEGTFDVVTLWCVVAHVADPVSLLREAASMLVAGGRVLITTPNFLFQKHYARALNRVGRRFDFRDEDHLLNFTPQALTRVATAAGFVQPSFHYFGITEACVMRRSLSPLVVPLKRLWNSLGSRAPMLGLPPLGGDLQLVAARAATAPPAGRS